MKPRHYWHKMLYRCGGGEFETWVYLEDGCEGPRDVLDERRGRAYTRDGREVLPVPFVAFHCGNGHRLTHHAWQLDTDVDYTDETLTNGVWRFLYPDRRERRRLRELACGVPTPPGVAV